MGMGSLAGTLANIYNSSRSGLELLYQAARAVGHLCSVLSDLLGRFAEPSFTLKVQAAVSQRLDIYFLEQQEAVDAHKLRKRVDQLLQEEIKSEENNLTDLAHLYARYYDVSYEQALRYVQRYILLNRDDLPEFAQNLEEAQ